MKTHITIVSIVASTAVLAGELYTAPFGIGGTWNLYQLVDDHVTWNDAKRIAEETKAPVGNSKLTGHLVTLSSIAENHFMRFVSNRRSAWCGLTDDERFGGKEAGSHPRNGWKWVTGEPLTFSNWKPNEPDDWTGGGTGEDAVFIERYGQWSDANIGVTGQDGTRLPYIIEWETRAAKPVAGAIPLTAVWPKDFVMPKLVLGKWNARWVSGYVRMNGTSYRRPQDIPDATALFAKIDTTRGHIIQSDDTATGRMPWLWLATNDVARQGWLPHPVETMNFPGLPSREHYIGAVVGKIHVETAGLHTFAITAEEAFALRIGGLKWKSASGDGYIDPLDPLTVTQPHGTFSAKALAVMDLPAGDHLVEALWMVETTGSEFHVLSAPGTHLTEGSTTDWRPLGHPIDSEKVPSLGITEAGWTVDCSMGTPPDESGPQLLLQEGLLKLELDLGRISKSGLSSINFADAPETHPSHFPDASVFPNDRPGKKHEHWPLRARARLVVPADGLYQIGLHAAGLAALRIKGGEFNRYTQTAQGLKRLNQQGDSFDFDGQVETSLEPKIVSEWMLKKGEYDIEVFYVKNLGPGALAVFSCPSGPYAPGLLTVGGAKLADDVPGLPHASR